MTPPTQRVVTGCLFMAVGLLGWVGLGDLDVGTLSNPGPAFFPRLVAALLIAMGGLNLLGGLLQGGLAWKVSGRPVKLGAFLLVFLGLGGFFALLPFLGLIPASLFLVMVASMATGEARFKESLVLGGVLTLLAILLFKGVLGLSIPYVAWGEALV